MTASIEEYDAQYLEGLLNKANRVFFQNLEREMDCLGYVENQEEFLLKSIQDKRPFVGGVIWHDGLSSLAGHLINYFSGSKNTVRTAFPIHDNPDFRMDARVCPYGLFHLFLNQFAWGLFCDGRILAVAQDGDILTPVIEDDFLSGYSGLLEIPDKDDYIAPWEHEDMCKKSLGADRIWFALANELPNFDSYCVVESEFANTVSCEGRVTVADSGIVTSQLSIDHVASILDDIEKNNDTVFCKTTVISFIKKFLQSKKAAGKAWDKADIVTWKAAGRRKSLGSEADFQRLFETAKLNQKEF